VCGQGDARGPSPCGTDGDCSESICVCGRCCVPTGQRPPDGFSCVTCCSGRCENGGVCA
jgi:hypothetical protein